MHIPSKPQTAVFFAVQEVSLKERNAQRVEELTTEAAILRYFW